MAVLCAIRVLLLQCMLWLRQVCVHGRGQTRLQSNLQGKRAGTLPNVGSVTNAHYPQHVQWSCTCSPAVDPKHCALTSVTRYRARPAAIQCELRQSSTACLFTQACSPCLAAASPARRTPDHRVNRVNEFTAGTLQDLQAIHTNRQSRSRQCRFTILVPAAGVAARSRNFSCSKLCYIRHCPGWNRGCHSKRHHISRDCTAWPVRSRHCKPLQLCHTC